MTNILCTSNYEIGVMGQLMIIIENIESNIKSVNDIENIVIHNTREIIDANPFEHIFVMNNSNNDYVTINIKLLKIAYSDVIPINKLLRFKAIRSKFILNDEIINRFNKIKTDLLINEAFLGVHVRLSDMNKIHGNVYGYVYFEDFVKTIDYVMKTDKYTKIFIASDTQEAILKLKKIYGDTMVCYDDFIRLDEEYGNLSKFIEENLPTNKKWIQDSFIEMLLLAKCGGFIYRQSNFANVVKVYSDTIKKAYFIHGNRDNNCSPIIYIEDNIIKAIHKNSYGKD